MMTSSLFVLLLLLIGLAVAGESDTLKHLDCPFNSNLCFWTLKSGEAQFVSSSILPEGSISQSDYLYLKQTHKNEPAVLQVDVSNNDQDSACISFQVSGYSGLRRPLQLIQMLDSSRETIIWSLESFHLFTWIPVQIQVPLSQVNSIQLRSYQSAVGIRQLTASLEHCQLPLYSFEIDEVELSQNANQTEPHFEIIQASDAIDSKLPTIDVTLKSSQGHYIVSRRPSLSNQSAIWALRKPILSPQSTRYALRADCLHFNLFQSNENSEYLNVVATYNRFGTAPTRQQTLWSSKGLVFSPLVTWNHVKLQVQAVDKTLIEFHAIPLNRESHPIGLDDIQVESGPCSTLWINCRFDRDTCDFQAVEQDVQFKVGPLQLADEHLLSLPVPSSLYLESMLYADFTEFDLDSTEAGPSTDSFAIASGGRTLRLIQSPLPPTVTGMLWIQCQVLILSSPQSEFEFSLHFLSPDHVEPLKLISYNQVTPNWTDVEFMVFSQSSWQTMIEAKVDSAGHLPLIAVRNFQFKVATRSDLEEQRKVPNDAITCDFLTDFCGWRNTGNGTFVLAAYSHARLPHYDLFHGQRGGQFVAAEDDSVWSPQTLTAKLLSPLHVETSDRLLIYCFSFYFSARSSCSDTLRFEVRLDNQKTLFIYGHETSPSRWLRKQITFTAKGSFRLQVAATYRSGIVAFDKPQLMHGFCGSSLNRTQSMVEHNHIKAINFERDSASELSDSLCDFELNDCGFFSNNFYRFSRIPMGQVSIQPSIDHSTRSAKGKAYVFDLSDKLSRTVSPASLFFPLLYFKDNVCLSFWLNVAGSASIDIQMNQVQRLLVLPQMEPDNAWYPQFMQLNQLDYVPMKLAFNVQPSNERNGFVAIDDVQLITGMCPPAICSFDLPDQCAWRTVSGHFDYTEVNGQNRSIDDLLPYEVVSGHGNFPTTDASIGTVDGFFIRPVSKVVVLQSPKLFTRSSSSPDIYCLHYAYYQTSDDDSDDRLIRVLVRFGGSKSIARELFTLHTPNTSYAWKRQQVPIDGAMLRSAGVDPKRGEFSILLVLGKETKPIRNLAFDDIGIIAGRCARHEMFFCEIGKKPASEHLDWAQVCDFRRDCANGRDEQVCATCEFEKDLCGYHMFREVYDQKTNATNLLRDIARSVDIRNGIEFQERSLLMRSRHTLKEAPVNCELRFRYRYRNVHLQVNRLTTSQQTRLWSSREFGLPDTLIDSVETDVNPASIELHMFRSANIRLEFVFERVVPSNNESSWVALDWIRLENCDRPVKKALDVKWIGMSTTISPLDPDLFSSKKMFTCKNGQKIDASLECDLANDCEDYTDEADCYWNKYSTHFELGSKRLHRKGDWYLFKSLSTLTAPDFDHTSGTSSGTYLLLSGALNLSRTSGSGWLMVPTINPQFDCDLRLFYRTNRADATSIRVTWLSMNDATIRYVEQRNLSLASRWTRTVFSISHDVSNQRPWIEGLYRIAIEAKFNSGQADSNAYLAIDDISLSRGCYVRQPKDADCFMNSGDMINCNWQFVMSRQQKQRFHLVKSTWSRLTIADIPIQMETALSHIILFVGQTSFDRLEAKLAKQEIEADHYVELKEPETTFFVNDSASIDLNVIHFQSPEFDCTSRDKNQVWNLVIHAALFGQHTGSLEVVEVTSNERIWRSDGRLGHFGGIVVPFDCPLGRNRQLDVRFRIDGPMSVVVLFDVIVQTNRLTKPLVCDFDTSSDCHLIIPIGLHFHVRNRWLDRSGSTSASSQSFDQVPDQTMKTSSGGLMYAQCAPDRKLTMVLSNTGPIAFWFRRVRSKICPTSKARPMRISVRNLFGSAPIVWWSHTFLDKQNLGSIEEFDEDDWQQAAFEYISSSRAFSLKGQNRLRIDCGDSNDWILFDQFGPLARPELNDAFYCEFEHDSLCNWVGRSSDGVGGWLQSQIHETVFQDVSSYRPNVSIASDQTLNRVEPANNFVYISFDSLSLHREYRLTSPLYAAKRRCLRFSYWMSERAKLRVQVLSVMEGNVQELTVLTESRRHWTEAQVQLHSELINVGQQIIIVVRNLDPHAVHTTSTFALDSIFSDLGHCSGLDQDSDYLQDDFDDGLVTIIEDSNEDSDDSSDLANGFEPFFFGMFTQTFVLGIHIVHVFLARHV